MKEYQDRNNLLEDHIRQLLDVKDAYDSLIKEKDLLTVEASKGHIVLQQWKERCDELQMSKDAALTQVRQYREKIEELMTSEKEQLEQRFQREATEKKERKLLKQKCDNLQAQLDSTKKQLDDTLKQQHDELNSLMTEVKQVTSASGGSLAQARMLTTPTPLNTPLSPFGSTGISYTSAQQRSKLWKKLREEIIALKQRNVVLAKQIMSVTKENQNNSIQYESEMNQMKEDMENLNLKLKSIEDNSNELAELKKNYEKLNFNFETSQKELQETRTENDELKKSNAALQSTVNRLQNEKKSLSEQKEKLLNRDSKARIHEKNDQKQLLQEIDNLKEKISSETNQFNIMKNHLENDYKSRLKEMRDQKEYHENRCQILKQKVEILQRSEKSLQLQLKEARYGSRPLGRESIYPISNENNILPERPQSASSSKKLNSSSINTPTALSLRRNKRKIELLQNKNDNIYDNEYEDDNEDVENEDILLNENNEQSSRKDEISQKPSLEPQLPNELNDSLEKEINLADTAPIPRVFEPQSQPQD